MAYSTQRATSDGTLQVLPIAIEFFDRPDIRVFINEVPATVGVEYNWLTGNVIKFTVPVPNGQEVLLRRETDKSEPRHIFDRGSPFNFSTLDEDFRQILFIAQEAIEGSNVGDIYTTLDMHGNRIKNVGVAVEDGDAVSLGQIKTESQGAVAANAEAKAAAARAEVQANGANAHRIAAEVAQAAAKASQNAAATSAQSSLDYSGHSKLWASQAEGVVVSGGLYSSYHYSRKAAASAASITGAEAAAAASAAAAKASEDKAKQWAQESRADASNITYTGPAGEARKVQDLSGIGGARLVSTSSGKTIQAELDRIATIASPGPTRPIMKYGSATAWKFLTRHATLNGFRWGGNVTNPYGRTLPIPPSFEASLVGTGLGAETTHVKENWYAAFACANPGDTIAAVKCMPFVRVKSVAGLVLYLGAAGERVGATPADKTYNWTAAHNLNGCDILICNQGMGTLQMHTVKCTGNREGTITVSSATNIAAGSFLLIAPPGYSEYGYLGSVYMDTQEIRNFYDDGSEVQQYGVAHLDVTSGGISTPVAINMAGYICPLAVASLIEVSSTGFGSGGGSYREDYGGDSAHFPHGRYTEGTFTTNIFNARVAHSYLYQVFYLKTAGTKHPTSRQILGRGYVER